MKLLLAVAFIFQITICSSTAFAQFGGDDIYDPFADYSEFEENSQEEADIFFFRNGRFFNIAFLVGWDQFTSELGAYTDPAMMTGLYVSYFFNLRFALQVSYTFSNHRLDVRPINPEILFDPIIGSMSFSVLSFHLKYYINTQNVTRGLANLNPYILGGFAQNYRTTALNNVTAVAKDDSTSFDIGLGMEIPIANNQMYIGAEAYYRALSFPAENQQLFDQFNNGTGVFLSGDAFNIFVILGINF